MRGEPRRVQAGVVPAHAHLQRHRHRHGAHGRLQDARGGGLVAHQRAAGALADRDLLHRAAEIDVDQVGAATDRDARRLGHRRRVAAGELDRGRRRRRSSAMRSVLRFSRTIAQEAIISDTTRPAPSRARQPAERQVGDARHRRQDDRRVDPDAAAEVDRPQHCRHLPAFVRIAHDLGRIIRAGLTCNTWSPFCGAHDTNRAPIAALLLVPAGTQPPVLRHAARGLMREVDLLLPVGPTAPIEGTSAAGGGRARGARRAGAATPRGAAGA